MKSHLKSHVAFFLLFTARSTVGIVASVVVLLDDEEVDILLLDDTVVLVAIIEVKYSYQEDLTNDMNSMDIVCLNGGNNSMTRQQNRSEIRSYYYKFFDKKIGSQWDTCTYMCFKK